MDATTLMPRLAALSGRSLRQLARLAGTSHSALVAYRQGRTDPGVATLDRIAERSGLAIEPTVVRRVSTEGRSEELLAVLELAAAFPARHSPTLEAPVFGHAQRR